MNEWFCPKVGDGPRAVACPKSAVEKNFCAIFSTNVVDKATSAGAGSDKISIFRCQYKRNFTFDAGSTCNGEPIQKR